MGQGPSVSRNASSSGANSLSRPSRILETQNSSRLRTGSIIIESLAMSTTVVSSGIAAAAAAAVVTDIAMVEVSVFVEVGDVKGA